MLFLELYDFNHIRFSNEHNIEIKTHIVTLINNRVQQYMKLYNLKVKHAR